MIKFLTKKDLLTLVPFQSASPYDAEYIWPEAYSGDIENLMVALRQCPSYQIDKNHSHCGFRTKLLPALDYIKSCIDTGLGLKLIRSKSGPSFDSWATPVKTNGNGHKKAWVGNGNVNAVDIDEKEKGGKKDFNFASVKPKMMWGGTSGEGYAKELFIAEKWNWITEQESGARLGQAFGSMTR